MKQIKLIFTGLFLIFSLFVTGCGNIGGDIDAAFAGENIQHGNSSEAGAGAERKLVTLSGTVRIPKGVVPSSLYDSAEQDGRDDSGNARVIIPDFAAGTQNIVEKYVITAHCTSFTTADVTVEVTGNTYTLGLLTGTWNILCEGKTAEADGVAAKTILEASVNDFTVSDETTAVPDLSLAPKAGASKGSVKINIKAEATSGITACSISVTSATDGEAPSFSTNVPLNGNLDAENYYNGVFQSSLAAGTYKTSFRFTKDSVCVFAVQEILYVFSDCVSDKWTSTSVYNDGNSISVSKVLAEKGIQNELFVDGYKGNDAYIGDFFTPLATVGKAVELLESFGYTTGTINVKSGSATEETSEIVLPETLNSLKIKAYGGTGTGSGKGEGDGVNNDVLETDFTSNATIKQSESFAGTRLFTSTATEFEFVGITLEGNASINCDSGAAINTTMPLKLTDCYVHNFSAGVNKANGGAICINANNISVESVIKNSVFINNSVKMKGGAIALMQGTLICDGVALCNNSITERSSISSGGGGIYLDKNSSLKTAVSSEKNYIKGNSAYAYGGGIWALGASGAENDVLLDNFIITENTTSNSSYGGAALYINGVRNFQLTNTVVSGNSAPSIYTGGVYLSSVTNAYFGSEGGSKADTNKTIIGKTAEYIKSNKRGGVYLISVQNAYFYGNAELNDEANHSISSVRSNIYFYNDFTIQSPESTGSYIYKDINSKFYLAENFTTPGIHGKITLEKAAYASGTQVFEGSDPAGQNYSDFFVIDNATANNTSGIQWTIDSEGNLVSPYDFYIASTASGGSDTGNNGTKAQPFYTLQKAVDTISQLNEGNGSVYNIYLKENMVYNSDPASGIMAKIDPQKEMIINIKPDPALGADTKLLLTKAVTAANCGIVNIISSTSKATVTVSNLQFKNYSPSYGYYLFSCTGSGNVLNIEDCIIGEEVDVSGVGTDASLIQELTTSTKYANKGNLINVGSKGTVNVGGRTVIAHNYYDFTNTGVYGFIYCNNGTLNFGKDTLLYANTNNNNSSSTAKYMAYISSSNSSFNGTFNYNNCMLWYAGADDSQIGDDAVFEGNLDYAIGCGSTNSKGNKITIGNAIFKNNGLLSANNTNIYLSLTTVADIKISAPKECEGYFIRFYKFSEGNSLVLSSAVDSSKWNSGNPLRIYASPTVSDSLNTVLKGNPGDAEGAGAYTLTAADCEAFTVIEKTLEGVSIPHAISLDAANNAGVIIKSTGEGSFAAGQPYEENTVAADTWNVSGATGGTISLSLKQNGTVLNDVDWSTADIKVYSRGEDISSRTGISITGNKVTLPAGIPVAENIQIYCKVIYNGTEYGGLYDVTVME